MSIMTPIQTASARLFNPAAMSRHEHADLNTLLNELDALTDERDACMIDAGIKSMKKWLASPRLQIESRRHKGHIHALPSDRWALMVKAVRDDYEVTPHKALIDSFLALDEVSQKDLVAYAGSSYMEFVDPKEERRTWDALATHYKTILRLYPNILSSEADLESTIRLGKMIKVHKRDLTTTWLDAKHGLRKKIANAFFTQAYPDSDMNHLVIATAPTLDVGGSFWGAPGVDTIIIGADVLSQLRWEEPFLLLAHEICHREQAIKRDKLDAGLLIPGTTDYYQARLFKGAYMKQHPKPVHGAEHARYSDYKGQPVEVQADTHAETIFSIGGKPMSSFGWRFNRDWNSACSNIAKPIDRAVAYFAASITVPGLK